MLDLIQMAVMQLERYNPQTIPSANHSDATREMANVRDARIGGLAWSGDPKGSLEKGALASTSEGSKMMLKNKEAEAFL